MRPELYDVKKDNEAVELAERMTKQDYIYCEDCRMLVDFWKYDHNIRDTGHQGCNWRYVTAHRKLF